MAKKNAAKLVDVSHDAEGDDQQELELESADEIESKIREHCTYDTFRDFYDQLDGIEDKRKELDAQKKLLFSQMREKGCHPKGLEGAYTRRHMKSKQSQTAIDVTFRVACEMMDLHQELF